MGTYIADSNSTVNMTSTCKEHKDFKNDYIIYQGMEVANTGAKHNLSTPLDKINLHVRGGYVIPWQEPANTTVYRLKYSLIKQYYFQLFYISNMLDHKGHKC